MAPHERLFCASRAWSAVLARAIVPWALAGVQLRGDVLEIGTGAGAAAAAIASRPAVDSVTATDVDEEMVVAARRRFGARIEAVPADAAALPFPDASFDAVVSLLMLHHVGEWETAIAEAARVLRAGGVFAGADLVDGFVTRALHGFDTRHGERFFTRADLATTLSDAGFSRVALRGRGPLIRFEARKPDG